MPSPTLRPRLRGAHCVRIPLPAATSGARLRRPLPPGPATTPCTAYPHEDPRPVLPAQEQGRSGGRPPGQGETTLCLGLTPQGLPVSRASQFSSLDPHKVDDSDGCLGTLCAVLEVARRWQPGPSEEEEKVSPEEKLMSSTPFCGHLCAPQTMHNSRSFSIISNNQTSWLNLWSHLSPPRSAMTLSRTKIS